VEITCQPDGEFILFCVADNGPGIPDDLRQRLFEPFVRGPQARGAGAGAALQRRPEGAGPGPDFGRNVIQPGGRRGRGESTPGQGSRFWFTVRRAPPTTAS